MLLKMWNRRIVLPLPVGVQISTAIMEVSVVVPQKNDNLFQDQAIPLLAVYPKLTSSYHTDAFLHMSIDTPFTITKCGKQPRCSSAEEWIKKMLFILQWSITQMLENMTS